MRRRKPIEVPCSLSDEAHRLWWCAKHDYPAIEYSDGSVGCMWEHVVEERSDGCRLVHPLQAMEPDAPVHTPEEK